VILSLGATMRRRDFIRIVGAAATWPLAARAQQAGRVPRIGFLSDQSERPHPFNARDYILKRLRDLGYQDQRNMVVDYRYAAGELNRLSVLASELAALPVDVLIAIGTPASKAALAATGKIPIVFSRVADPVASGLVTSLAHPGGNATGTTVITSDLAEKRLALLKEIAPRVSRIGALHEKNFAPGDAELKQLVSAAPRLGLELHEIAVTPPLAAMLDAASGEIAQTSVEALFIGSSGWFEDLYQNTLELANKSRLPTLYVRPEFVRAGGLMSYGPDWGQMYGIAVDYVVRIIKGAKPSELPVQQPTTLKLLINLSAARSIGLNVPPPLIARADEVIE
jgi:putative tryptophan/tyrosine transport system substrate-binding protein